jgi:hypothetical protein
MGENGDGDRRRKKGKETEKEEGEEGSWGDREGGTHVELVIGGRLDGAVLGERPNDLDGFLELGFRHNLLWSLLSGSSLG